MERTSSVERCIDVILERVGPELRVGTPLGLGKPNHLLNALYRRACRDPQLQVTIYTALTLGVPRARSELEKRFLEPFTARVYAGYPELDYERDRVRGELPHNVRVCEFYFQPGKFLSSPAVQRDHICTNYTYVARDLLDQGVNVLMQQVAVLEEDGGLRLSLGSNADVSLDMEAALRGRDDVAVACQTNGAMPFMFGDAELSTEVCHVVVHDPEQDFPLFGVPKQAVPDADTLIGLTASALVPDAGDLQIGIGSLGDAVAYALCLRHRDNGSYCRALTELGVEASSSEAIDAFGHRGPFERGLFAATEMMVDGYQHLWEAGVLRRRVYDHETLQTLLNEGCITEQVTPDTLRLLIERAAVEPELSPRDVAFLVDHGVLRADARYERGELVAGDVRVPADLGDPENFACASRELLGTQLKGGAVLHAGFFLGPDSFYQWLRDLSPEQRALIQMRSVRRINQLYGDEGLRRKQRARGRFLNTGMMVTLAGAVVSDGLEDGRVVSGVGGQHDFVAMAHALEDGHSVLMIRATRTRGGETVSNIVASYGHVTLPRHQRDVIVTEYGVAVLRGKTDEQVVRALIQVADSRFQPELIEVASKRGKLPPGFELEERFRHNLPERYAPALARLRARGLFPRYPFGTDLDELEQVLVDALQRLKQGMQQPREAFRTLGPGVLKGPPVEALRPYLARMGLDEVSSLRDRLMQQALIVALRAELGVREG